MSRPLDPLTQPLEGRCLIEASADQQQALPIADQ